MKKQIIFIITLLASMSVSSQEKGHYLSVGGNIGLSAYKYELTNGTTQPQIGYAGRIGYSYFFDKHWGIGTGIGLSFYSTEGTFDKYHKVFYNQIDTEGDVYDKIVALSDNVRNVEGWQKWTEEQRGAFLEIPLLLQYQHKFGDRKRVGLYFNAGIKGQLPISSEYLIASGSQSFEGDYNQWNVVLYDLPEHGLSVYLPRPASKVELKPSFAATGGLGFLFGLARNIDMYLGAYCDYGLNDIKKHNEDGVLFLNEDNEVDYRSMLASNTVKTVNLFSVGGEVGVRFKLGKAEDVKLDKEQQKILLEAEEARRKAQQEAEEARLLAEKKAKEEAEKREAERAEEIRKIAELEAKNRLLESLLAKASEIKSAKVEKVIGENNLEAVKVEFNSNILFPVNKSSLTIPSKQVLFDLVKMLKDNPETNIDIFGHTDNVGSLELNQNLSQNRALSVAEYLIFMGVPAKQIRAIKGKNYSEPVATNSTAEGRSKNRRVEIYLYVNRK